jgi:uncharacterized membrane protein YjfL (UPF0719 family)
MQIGGSVTWPEIALILAWGAMGGVIVVMFFELFDFLRGE